MPASSHPPLFDVAILGAGLGGLLCANLLLQGAPLSFRAALIEAREEAGGLARSPRLGAKPVNLGPHALYGEGHLHRTLDRLGVSVRGGDPSTCAVWLHEEERGELFSLPTTALGLWSHGAMTRRERVAFASAASELALAPLREKMHRRTARQWLDTIAKREPIVAKIFAMWLRTASYSARPEWDSEYTARARLKMLWRHGVRYVDGGWQHMVDALKAGVTSADQIATHRSTRVTSVRRTAQGHCTIRSSKGEEFAARHVIMALPPKVTIRLLGDQVLGDGVALLGELRPVHAACLDMVLKWRASREERAMIYGLDAPLYYSNHSAVSTRHCDAKETQIVHAAKYITSTTDRGDVVRELEQWLDEVDPSWRADVVDVRTWPRMKVMHHLPSETLPELARALPEGVHPVGDWCATAPTHLADGVAQSATRACDAILSLISAERAS